ncbi:GIY-YIG nuclease family protein [Streptomyces sp. SS07]|uniref:GIY-YIG nuclease family protein n=1 Tax=Streptomyces sp. SS07 TaxID=2015315 RepID=UPI000B5C655C|nr:GIY-YIG nuclease family protein [Streptomyces sp. SS07]
MDWQCRNADSYSIGHHAVVDHADGRELVVGCIQCDWHKFVAELSYDELLERELWSSRLRQCVAPTRDGSRCALPAGVDGMCHRHASDRPWEFVYQRFVNGSDDEIPSAYREVFDRALRDAKRHFELWRDAKAANDQKLSRQLKRTERESVVYFVRREGLIKIGVTTSLAARVKAIGKGSSMPPGMTVGPVQLLATTPGDSSLEYKLHTQFANQRITGTEWFRPAPRLLRLIARYQRRASESQSEQEFA